MAFPESIVEIAFASAPLATSPTWVDVTEWVTEFLTARGRPNEFEPAETGTATIILSNQDRRFDPTNASSPYYPNVISTRQTRIRTSHLATVRPLFKGYSKGWPQEYLAGTQTVKLDAYDAFGYLARTNLQLETFPVRDESKKSGTAIAWLLGKCAWPGSLQSLEAGVFTVLIDVDLKTNPLQYILDIAAAEAGIFFVDATGIIRFFDHNTILESPYDTVQATFGDGASELLYRSAEMEDADERIYNAIFVTPTGQKQPDVVDTSSVPDVEVDQLGTAYGEPGQNVMFAEDATSITNHFRRRLDLSVPLIKLQEAAQLANAYLSRHKDGHTRFSALHLEWTGNDAVMTQMLSREIGDMIRVIRRPRSGGSAISIDSHIEGIKHHFIARQGTWETVFYLSPHPVDTVLTPDTASAYTIAFTIKERFIAIDSADPPGVGLTYTTGLQYWFKADDVLDGELEPANNDRIETWFDKSGNTRDAVSPTSGQFPRYMTGQQNGLPSMYFDQTRTDRMNLAGGDQLSFPDATAFVVCKTVASNSLSAIWKPTDDTGHHILFIGASNDTGTREYAQANTNGDSAGTETAIRSATFTPPQAGHAIYMAKKSTAGGLTAFKKNGATVSGDTTTQLIGGFGITNGRWTGYIDEIIHYDHELASGPEAEVLAYLTAKWAIT